MYAEARDVLYAGDVVTELVDEGGEERKGANWFKRQFPMDHEHAESTLCPKVDLVIWAFACMMRVSQMTAGWDLKHWAPTF